MSIFTSKYSPLSRQYWGNVADVWGTALSPTKGWGVSEKIAGGPTIFTGRIPEVQAAEPQTPPQNNIKWSTPEDY